jgi:hypothetical protein
MPARERDLRAEYTKLCRLEKRADLQVAKLFDHLGIPQVTDEEVNEALAKDPLMRLVKPPTVATSQLSTDGSAVHRRLNAALPIRHEDPR